MKNAFIKQTVQLGLECWLVAVYEADGKPWSYRRYLSEGAARTYALHNGFNIVMK